MAFVGYFPPPERATVASFNHLYMIDSMDGNYGVAGVAVDSGVGVGGGTSRSVRVYSTKSLTVYGATSAKYSDSEDFTTNAT